MRNFEERKGDDLTIGGWHFFLTTIFEKHDVQDMLSKIWICLSQNKQRLMWTFAKSKQRNKETKKHKKKEIKLQRNIGA